MEGGADEPPRRRRRTIAFGGDPDAAAAAPPVIAAPPVGAVPFNPPVGGGAQLPVGGLGGAPGIGAPLSMGTPVQEVVMDPDLVIGRPDGSHDRGYYVQALAIPISPLERTNVNDVYFLIPDDGKPPDHSLTWTINTYGNPRQPHALFVYDIPKAKLLQGRDLQEHLTAYFTHISTLPDPDTLTEEAMKAFYKNGGLYYRKTDSAAVDRREMMRFKDYLDGEGVVDYLGINVGPDPSGMLQGARHGEIIIFTKPDPSIIFKGQFTIDAQGGKYLFKPLE